MILIKYNSCEKFFNIKIQISNVDVMKYFKELLLLSNIKQMSFIKINRDFAPLIPKIKDFNSYLEKKYSKEVLKKAMELSENTYEEIEESSSITAITIFDKEYPQNLKDLGDKAPPFLYVVGNSEILSKPNIGVAGTKKPDLNTQNLQYKFIHNIIEEYEKVIVSGLALGCDKIAHTAAVDMGEPTIAVLPSGINNISPERNIGLAKLIVENEGCLISSFKPNTRPNQNKYTLRNSYIAAISDGLFISQCSAESGTMNTFEHARKLGRKIGCLIAENGDFTGNKIILKQYGHKTLKIKSVEEFNEFINFLEAKEKKRDYQSTLFDFV